LNDVGLTDDGTSDDPTKSNSYAGVVDPRLLKMDSCAPVDPMIPKAIHRCSCPEKYPTEFCSAPVKPMLTNFHTPVEWAQKQQKDVHRMNRRSETF